MKTALVVIDVQNHFAVDQAAHLPEKIAKHINDSSYDFILFICYKNDPESNFYKILGHTQLRSGPSLNIHSALRSYSNSDNTFEKTTFSAFKAPKFKKFLEDNAITDLFLCGINLDGCVLATAFDAFDLGYKFDILEDLSSVSSTRRDFIDSAKTIISRNLKRRTSAEKIRGDILDLIRHNPGIRPSEINRKLKLDHSANVRNQLIKDGLIIKEKSGSSVKYYACN